MGLYLCLKKDETELYCPICGKEMGAYIPGGSQTKSFNNDFREKLWRDCGLTKKEILKYVKNNQEVEFISQCSNCKIGVIVIFNNTYSEEI